MTDFLRIEYGRNAETQAKRLIREAATLGNEPDRILWEDVLYALVVGTQEQ